MNGLDTSVLLRILIDDDPEQARRIHAFLAARPPDERLFVNRIVICELIWTLRSRFRFDRAQIADVVDRLLKSELMLEDYDALGYALYLFRASGADFADCLIGVTNAFAGCEDTVTFDRKAAELDQFELI